MLKTHKAPEKGSQFSTPSDKVVHGRKNLKLMDVNYRRNTESDYTEKIEELYKNFDYSSNSDYYWGEPELSMLYGSPLYEAASPSQQKALNHLYWALNYYLIAATETNTILFNEVTANAFFPFDDYEVICHALDLETNQERYHVRAFNTIGSKTELALMGETVFHCPRSTKPKEMDKTLAAFKGMGGRTSSRLGMQVYTISISNSPFLASQYYTARGIGNLNLKNKEYSFSQLYKRLEKNREFIPAPTAVSRYHLLDESFHTATSQLMSHEIYKDFPQPNAWEKYIGNQTIHSLQTDVFNGLSTTLPGTFGGNLMPMVYKLLQTPLFSMSKQEALLMMEKCFCQEHQGLHVAAKYHQRLLSDIRKFLEGLDYLSPVNREMRLMASSGSVEKAVANNIREFKQFSRSVKG
ncbi:hypothetical protein BJP34_09565 [Moorena producens PAL-8-15-08-1]|uniref:p-aminobenzoate N-oxygenase AurF n=1 Tax=Moorena producens PAL-8-15-08-1 TaxID=1458985 RepID=A0A1D8TQ37_9CYAN|nr:hypothetical protein [Moorena producens]AOW99672.1 hypothetical protein BJP34_09565 [Moorena producens PAL-8-15-08-1]